MSPNSTIGPTQEGPSAPNEDDQLLIDLHGEVLALMRRITDRYLPTVQLAAWAGQEGAQHLCVNMARAVHEEQTHPTLQSPESEWRYYSDGSLAAIAHWARTTLRSRNPRLTAELDRQIDAFRFEQFAEQ